MELRVHLKVCEGCGCLWYRLQDEVSVYCASCNVRFKDFPKPQSRKHKGRPKKTTLPTVFAVHAPFEKRQRIRLHREQQTPGAANAMHAQPIDAPGAQQTRLRNTGNSHVEALCPGKTPLALVASHSLNPGAQSVLQGGAQ